MTGRSLRQTLAGAALALGWVLAAAPLHTLAQTQAQAVTVGVISLDGDPRYAPRRVERAYPGHPVSRAVEGVKLAAADSAYELGTLGLQMQVSELRVREAKDLPAALAQMKAQRVRYLVSDLPAPLLQALVAQAPATLGDVVVFNASSDDDTLRAQGCARQLLHTYPSRAMLSDALAQYLAAQRWTQALVLNGSSNADAAWRTAFERSAKRFGVKLVAQRDFALSGDPRQRDLGNVRLLTSDRQHDVVVVLDTDGEFARTVPYATNQPRPVVGASGLSALAWHPQWERYGAPQLTRRFGRQAHASMVGQDWAAWMAGRAIAAALVQRPKGSAAEHLAALRGGDITLDGFKGRVLSFRAWDGQLRQPVFLSHGDGVVGLAPMDGVLHPTEVLDTLGVDEKESPCKSR